MILRIWNGFTTKENADVYQTLLFNEIFPGIAAKQIKGYKRVQLLRKELESETQFTTIMWFDRLQSVIDFVGEDYEQVYVPASAQKVLARYDQKSMHHNLVDTLEYDF